MKRVHIMVPLAGRVETVRNSIQRLLRRPARRPDWSDKNFSVRPLILFRRSLDMR